MSAEGARDGAAAWVFIAWLASTLNRDRNGVIAVIHSELRMRHQTVQPQADKEFGPVRDRRLRTLPGGEYHAQHLMCGDGTQQAEGGYLRIDLADGLAGRTSLEISANGIEDGRKMLPDQLLSFG
jgi:hypothetical protein